MNDTMNNNIEENSAKPVLDNLGRSYATGKRKNAVARVWIKDGSGKIVINGKDVDKYFLRPVLNMLVNQPLELTNKKMKLILSERNCNSITVLKSNNCRTRVLIFVVY